ncbi:hypothetical protein [Lichenifustis flavocetrariae]|uniref:Uncharacterized protein n=1 Tax=Lichenifustis flavocetrariae TaxID=2949735 RepID=A0AA41Z164_9HYPH|nr:hypothetical protein [Lichenifustis flavocetrariae]MCW6510950.1 hypothetical protein [Lichenifustis flavocetrariae]
MTERDGKPHFVTAAQSAILRRMADGGTLTRSLAGERMGSLLEDPFTVFDDVSPRLLLAAGFVELVRLGRLRDDRANVYRITAAGRAVLKPGP